VTRALWFVIVQPAASAETTSGVAFALRAIESRASIDAGRPVTMAQLRDADLIHTVHVGDKVRHEVYLPDGVQVCQVAYCTGRMVRQYRAVDGGDVEPSSYCSRCGRLAY
jgi:hypothetical protein